MAAHTLQLTDGTTTVDLASNANPGINLVSFVPPAPSRAATRTSGWPYNDGQRTVAASYMDVQATIVCRIYGSSVDNVAAQLLTLNNLLTNAVIYEEQRFGAPVRLAWKQAGMTNTAYWVLTGVTGWPSAVGKQGWLDEETANKNFTFTMTLSLEPVAHASTLTTLANAASFTNKPTLNTVAISAAPGDASSPLSVQFTSSGSANPDTLWLALIPQGGSVIVQDYNNTVRAGAYSGAALTVSLSGSVVPTSPQAIADGTHPLMPYPYRVIARINVASGTPTVVQIRARVNMGGQATALQTPWATVPIGTSSANWTLVDVGSIAPFTGLLSRTLQTLPGISVYLELQTSDGSAATVWVDYFEAFPILGYAKLTCDPLFPILGGEVGVIEDIAVSGSFNWPRQTPQAYWADGSGNLAGTPTRAGKLGRLNGSSTATLWLGHMAGLIHTIANTGTITVKALAMYTGTLRGAS
jgi:hypothetical protein